MSFVVNRAWKPEDNLPVEREVIRFDSHDAVKAYLEKRGECCGIMSPERLTNDDGTEHIVVVGHSMFEFLNPLDYGYGSCQYDGL